MSRGEAWASPLERMCRQRNGGPARALRAAHRVRLTPMGPPGPANRRGGTRERAQYRGCRRWLAAGTGRLGLPAPAQGAHHWLGGEVRDENANAICAQLLLLAAEDPDRDIYLYINSPGGSVTAGMAIYDTMQYIKPDVVTVGMGLAASMGQFLLTAGAPGKRYITPHTRVLLHQPLGGAGGSATEIRINADLILGMKKELAAITASRTGKTVEQVEADGDRDHWFTAQEALEYGFVDRVIDSPQEIGTRGEN